MNDNNKLTPKIRFKGFTDVWEQRKVTDIGENFNTSTLGYADLCRNGKYKCVLYGELYTRYNERIFNVNSRTNTEATEVKRNDILFPTSTTVDAISLISPSCVNEDNIRVGGDLFGIRPYQNIDGNFISYCINNFNPVKYSFAKQAQGLTIVHLQYNAIKNEKIKIPSLKEQNKMSDLFIQIDNLITLHQRKYDKLVNMKKSMLEKMFPKNPSNPPEIRFKGFTDVWEQRKLLGSAEYIDGNYGESYPKDSEFVESGIPFFTSAVTGSQGIWNYKYVKYITKEKNDTLLKAQSKGGDLVLTNRGASMGVICQIPLHYKDVNIGPQLTRIRGKENILDNLFLLSNLKTKKCYEQLLASNAGSAMPFISLTNLSNLNINVPNYAEQIKLGKIFYEIDNLITLHQRKLAKLQNIKKSLLEKMFV